MSSKRRPEGQELEAECLKGLLYACRANVAPIQNNKYIVEWLAQV